jgi:hypothetical protein
MVKSKNTVHCTLYGNSIFTVNSLKNPFICDFPLESNLLIITKNKKKIKQGTVKTLYIYIVLRTGIVFLLSRC